MSSVEWLLRVVGASQIALAGLHMFFPRRFGWKEELSRLSLLNRQIFVVHCIFIGLSLVLMGSLGLFAPEALIERSWLGLLVSTGFAFFWTCRLFAQWFVYDWALWRGKRFETAMHVTFTGLWISYVAVYALVIRIQLQ